MMVLDKIRIEKFKKIKDATLDKLGSINVLIGSNNSGKSSIIQGIQFAISSAQSIRFNGTDWTKKKLYLTTSLAPDEFLYTPIGDIRFLYHERPIKGSRKNKNGEKVQDSIRVHFEEKDNIYAQTSIVSIYKGQIKNLSVRVDEKTVGQKITDLNKPYSIYVPGLSGIPNNESYVTPLAIRKIAAKGDANNVLRNILLDLKESKLSSWENFCSDLQDVFPDLTVDVSFNKNRDEFINVFVTQGSLRIPIDCLGTGVLQAIQIFSYIHYFEPTLLLLDEPDAHVHPANQKKIINKLQKVAYEKALKVILTTHSSHVLSAIDKNTSQIYWAHNGKVEVVEDSYKVLMDIGALDAEYLFGNQRSKVFLLTEDEVEDIKANKEYLKTLAISNGFNIDETVLFSYHGCSNLYTAKVLKQFIRKHIPSAEVIIHRDRDFFTDEDIEKMKDDANRKGINLFFTTGNDIESHFVQIDHLCELFSTLTRESLLSIIDEAIEEAKEESEQKICDFLINNKREDFLRHGDEISFSKLTLKAKEVFESDKYLNAYSKKVKGLVTNKISQKIGGQIDLNKSTNALKIDELNEFIKDIW